MWNDSEGSWELKEKWSKIILYIIQPSDMSKKNSKCYPAGKTGLCEVLTGVILLKNNTNKNCLYERK